MGLGEWRYKSIYQLEGKESENRRRLFVCFYKKTMAERFLYRHCFLWHQIYLCKTTIILFGKKTRNNKNNRNSIKHKKKNNDETQQQYIQHVKWLQKCKSCLSVFAGYFFVSKKFLSFSWWRKHYTISSANITSVGSFHWKWSLSLVCNHST